MLARLLTFTVVRTPATQAGFFFTLQCIFRSGPHRAVMAGCTAVSIALATVFLVAGRSTASGLESVPLSVLATQTVALAVLLSGFRHLIRLPADTRANRLFRTAWIADSGRFLAGVRRGGFAGIILPAVLLLLPPHLYLLGTRLAVLHAVSGLLLGAALISLITLRMNQLPFVASYAPASDLNTVGPVVLIGGLIAISMVSRAERFALGDLAFTVIFWCVPAAMLLTPALLGRNMALDLPSAFDVPAAGTTRLDLG